MTSNMVLCFVYGCNHNSLWESCTFYTFRIRAVYTCTRPYKRLCTGRVHSRPCTSREHTSREHGRVHGHVHGPIHVHTAVYGVYTGHIARVHVYTVVYTAAIYAVYTCTRPVHRCVYGRVHSHVHARTRSCTRVYMGRVHMYRVHGRPCTDREQFYMNNATNLHHLASHSVPRCPTTQRSYCDQRLL